jgi:hypothetical protein
VVLDPNDHREVGLLLYSGAGGLYLESRGFTGIPLSVCPLLKFMGNDNKLVKKGLSINFL